MFRKNQLLTKEEESTVVAAIAAAEQGNRGEVRVHLTRSRDKRDVLEQAQEQFGAMSMHQTAEGTAVLLFVAVARRQAAVYAGPGLCDAPQEGFWQDVINEVSAGFRSNQPAEGLCRAVHQIGDLLRRIAPEDDHAGNELPDQVTVS